MDYFLTQKMKNLIKKLQQGSLIRNAMLWWLVERIKIFTFPLYNYFLVLFQLHIYLVSLLILNEQKQKYTNYYVISLLVIKTHTNIFCVEMAKSRVNQLNQSSPSEKRWRSRKLQA